MHGGFEVIGGEHGLRAIIDEFVDRCFDDAMIGFTFRDAKRVRVKKFEAQHAAAWLGSGELYQGRTLTEAHRAHRILGGQFERRLQILREVLIKHQVPEGLRERWLRHQESLRSEITQDPDSHCRD